MQNQAFIFIGRSGAGKGTQAALLREYLARQDSTPIFNVETGDHFRSFIKQESHSAMLAREIMNKGGLQPSFLASWLWTTVLLEKFTGVEHLIIDGSPRTLPEAHVLSTALAFYGFSRPHIIYLAVSRDVATDRLLARGRSDDAAEKIAHRLDWFDSSVAPVVEMYHNQDGVNFIELDGQVTIEDIHQEIIKQIA